jgi:hypothetical protein
LYKRIAKLLPAKEGRKFRKKALENKFFASFLLPAIPAFLKAALLFESV